VHIPLGELGARVEELPVGEEVYVICRSGTRSAQAVHALNRAGWTTKNVAGGMTAWAASNRPMVCESGGPAAVI
jgi:rhodanese-related sulfurtransferase